MKFKLIYICALFVFMILSCKYEEGPLLSLRTKKNRLTNETWSLREVVIDDQVYTSEDTISLDCIVQNCTFTDNSFFIIQKVINQNGFPELIEFNGDWSFIDNKNKIKVSYINSEGEKKVIEKDILRLTKSEFWFEAEVNGCNTVHSMYRK